MAPWVPQKKGSVVASLQHVGIEGGKAQAQQLMGRTHGAWRGGLIMSFWQLAYRKHSMHSSIDILEPTVAFLPPLVAAKML